MKRLLVLVAFATVTFLLANCEQAGGVPFPSDEDTSSSPACEGKYDDPIGCLVSLSGEDASSPDAAKGSSPDTTLPDESQIPPLSYKGKWCPN